MATKSRVSPRRFSTVPSSPANAPCRTLHAPPRRQTAFDRQRGVGGDQSAKLPQIENKLLRLLDRKNAGNPVGGQASHPFLLRPIEKQ